MTDWTAEAGIPEAEVGLLTRVVRLNMLVTRVLDGLVEPHGITVSDFLVLALVRRGRSSPVELCEVLGRTTGGMSLTLERLASAGWVDRRPDPRDRRRIIVELTAAGRTKAETVNQALHDWESALDLPPERRIEIEADLIAVTDLVETRREALVGGEGPAPDDRGGAPLAEKKGKGSETAKRANAKAAKEGKANPRTSSAAQSELGKKGARKQKASSS